MKVAEEDKDYELTLGTASGTAGDGLGGNYASAQG